jgi:7-cyano-7-deazaguanine synthase in queuosine biosynthesis
MILLFSGGMDSFIAWHYLDKPQTLYIDLGTPYAQKEIKVVKELVPTTIIENCLDLKSRQIGDYFIPYRNLYFAMLANKYSNNIVMAGLKDDGIEDKNEAIFAEWSVMLSKMIKTEVTVMSPFWQMTKEDIVKWYIDNVGDTETLRKTVSCYSEEDTNYCGRCRSCFKKWAPFWNNNIRFPYHNKTLMLMYYKKDYALKEKEISMKKAIEEFWEIYPDERIQNICVDLEKDLVVEKSDILPIIHRTPNKFLVGRLDKAWIDGDYILLYVSRKSDEELSEIREWLSKHNIKYDRIIT